ncbi:D-ala D-ala ligase C-terminus [Sulfidibacter corallicola]|uniref:D-alanine--D-alanine ligase n=1 Tax=Sulfidibacter corallicola TaxID=2818388 RepID=A0A8A4TUU7_SULCO|nr:hypothetical protein [Sulfidibacter corallicola]QTD53253.1 hypothetical protein J3U87_12430 [Sulfidibacter corallicola]
MQPLDPKQTRVAIFFGGPSNERNISLDSARTFFDSIRKSMDERLISLVFIGPDLTFHRLESQWIYSNTIEDFEGLDLPAYTAEARDRLLRETDVLCPIVHGEFGEDGALSRLFEDHGRHAYVGSDPDGLALTLDKRATVAKLAELGFPVVPNRLLSKGEWDADPAGLTADIFGRIPLDAGGRLITKPNNCGSSDGVSLVDREAFAEGLARAFTHSDQVLVEQRILGREFSLIVLQDVDGAIFPLLPTGIRVQEGLPGDETALYTRNKKYMPGAGAIHETPFTHDEALLGRMREQALSLFRDFGLRDWARFDGFVTEDGRIYWSDLNGIPGCGLDSFLFQQASLFGLRHSDVFQLMLHRAARREDRRLVGESARKGGEGMRVAVIGGGSSSERHVSRMSWFNVTQKLTALQRYRVTSVYLDREERYWIVAPFIALQHTVDEIDAMIGNPEHYRATIELCNRLKGDAFREVGHPVDAINFLPRQVALADFERHFDFVFLALHGGIGEDGTLQAAFAERGMPFNGSGSRVSRICMDKHETNLRCRAWAIPGFEAPGQIILDVAALEADLVAEGLAPGRMRELVDGFDRHRDIAALCASTEYQAFANCCSLWADRCRDRLDSPHGLVLKPKSDGCSSGVLVSRDPRAQIPLYLLFALSSLDRMPLKLLYPGVTEDDVFLQMPMFDQLIVEQYLGRPDAPGHFVEMTVGVLGPAGNQIALMPSETRAQTDVLSLDEKFNKGVGINLTPPPGLTVDQVRRIRERVATFANRLGIEGYARIDIMYQPPTDKVYLIEVNTLPGLTSATIIYTQALTTPETRLKPAEFLSRLIELGREARNRH